MNLSVLFVTYNRSDLLVRSVRSLVPHLAGTALKSEVIVADDCSSSAHRVAMNSLPFDRMVSGSVNGGLAVNANRGLGECRAPLILQIQDDWEYMGTEADLVWAVALMEHDLEIGILHLTKTCSDLPVKRRSFRGDGYSVFRNDGLFWNRRCGVRPYGDIPHLKRRRFVDDVGPYLEGVAMGVGENDYKRRVATQRKWKVAQIGRHPLFRHLGADASFNRAGQGRRVIAFLHALPLWGRDFERLLRGIVFELDHFCARIWAPVFERL